MDIVLVVAVLDVLAVVAVVVVVVVVVVDVSCLWTFRAWTSLPWTFRQRLVEVSWAFRVDVGSWVFRLCGRCVVDVAS